MGIGRYHDDVLSYSECGSSGDANQLKRVAMQVYGVCFIALVVKDEAVDFARGDIDGIGVGKFFSVYGPFVLPVGADCFDVALWREFETVTGWIRKLKFGAEA